MLWRYGGMACTIFSWKGSVPEVTCVCHEVFIEHETCEHCANGQQAKRHEHIGWAFMGMIKCMLVPAIITMEGHEYQTPAIECRHQRGDNSNPEGKGPRIGPKNSRRISRLNYSVFREETCKADFRSGDADTCNGESTDNHSDIGERNFLTNTAHFAHILFVMHGVNDRTCT